MVICAAIKYHIVNTDKEVVMSGLRHGDIMELMYNFGSNLFKYKEIEQGFIIHDGTFLNRGQALTHALKCGQLSSSTMELKHQGFENELYTEDIY